MQPAWLTAYFRGVEGHWRYRVVFESETWAVVKKPGHSSWNGRSEKRAWASTEYLLIRKSERQFDGTFTSSPSQRVLHTGRLTKGRLATMKTQMEQMAVKP